MDINGNIKTFEYMCGDAWSSNSHFMLLGVYTLQRTKRFLIPSVDGATRFANLRWKFSKT